MKYVFDVDGTLTPSRSVIDPEFYLFFKNWIVDKEVYLITGSDYAKTEEQLGAEICESVTKVYNCAGNAAYVKGQLVYQSDFKITNEQRNFLDKLLEDSPYQIRTGQHIEERIGLCNFSIVGRGANKQQRADYYHYDLINKERFNLTKEICKKFPELEATVAGETGIDIYPVGKDKSQIAEEVKPFTFFGDMIKIGGNDYTIAQKANKYFCVKNWEETYQILKEF